MPHHRPKSGSWASDTFQTPTGLGGLKFPDVEPEEEEPSRKWTSNEYYSLWEWESHARRCDHCYDAYGAQKSGRLLCKQGEESAQHIMERFVSKNHGKDIYDKDGITRIEILNTYNHTRDLFRAIERSLRHPEEPPFILPRSRSSRRQSQSPVRIHWVSSSTSRTWQGRSNSPDLPSLEHSPEPPRGSRRGRARSPSQDAVRYKPNVVKDARSKSPAEMVRAKNDPRSALDAPMPPPMTPKQVRRSETASVSRVMPAQTSPTSVERHQRDSTSSSWPLSTPASKAVTAQVPSTPSRSRQRDPTPSPRPHSQRYQPSESDYTLSSTGTQSSRTSYTSDTSYSSASPQRQRSLAKWQKDHSLSSRKSEAKDAERDTSMSPKKSLRRSSVVIPGSQYDKARRRVSIIDSSEEGEIRLPKDKRRSFSPYWVRR